MFCYYKGNAPSYILNQIELEVKGYGIKNSIANFMNQLSYTLNATNVLKYSSQKRVFLLLVSKKNLKPSSWCSNMLKIIEKKLEMRKLWPLKVKGVKNSKKKTIEHYKGRFLNTQKVPFMFFFY